MRGCGCEGGIGVPAVGGAAAEDAHRARAFLRDNSEEYWTAAAQEGCGDFQHKGSARVTVIKIIRAKGEWRQCRERGNLVLERWLEIADALHIRHPIDAADDVVVGRAGAAQLTHGNP